ncbi:elongation factor P maturation arginine rhamnosyltransferase EarP [Crenobacter cavernae]|uniref:Protein-arginine rhamnosyltransferase n=1 Tax=Crenobacter cavernae TaxID=2290923 RepID=A0A345Y750_9NEIS|nr:elongation factor P maturation arginine rhamnosyltransferase EarP [Crenobacter cavernae]AXK39752.1 elongation factor P maturation arginine rhamnosyltransferase EarP [Crenobacter cavernae]
MTDSTRPAACWDLFCTVIDNFGDIGVAWRLARQLADEYRLPLRLWVDDLESFARIEARLDPDLDAQTIAGVEIRRWTPGSAQLGAGVEPGEVVIEAFGCRLPDDFLATMAACDPAPLWLNLEYLSAEAWVDDCHGMASPHPRLPLTQYFYFPGFTETSGGLIGERDLPARRDAFLADTAGLDAYWASLGLPPRVENEMRISLFSYETPSLASLTDAWAASIAPVTVLVPEGRALAELRRVLGQPLEVPGGVARRGALAVHALAMTDQAGYDRLLWACDFNIVRGEDSFLRAQWAARPFLWHIYRQDEGAHLEKLDAFLERYTQGLAEPAAAALTALSRAFNRDEEVGDAWRAFGKRREALAFHAHDWAEKQAAAGDLAGRLVQFVQNRLK